MLMPSTLSLLRSIFRNRDQRRMAIAVWAAAFSAGAALGPVVGGLLLEHFAWGSVFLLAVPVLVPLLILVPILVPESRDPKPGRFDPLSVVLSLATMVPIVYAIKEFAVHGIESAAPLVMIAAGLAFGVLFVRRQNRLETPMLDMALFRRWSFTGSVLVNLLSVIGLVGFLYFVAQHLQLVVGLSPMEAGLALVPGLAMMIVAGIGVVPIAKRVAPRIVVPAALGFSVIGYLLVAVTASTGSLPLLIVAFVSLGVGIGAAETVSNELILASAPLVEGGRGQRRLRDGVRARRRARHDDHGRHPRGVLLREPLPAGRAARLRGRCRTRDARGRRRRGGRPRPALGSGAAGCRGPRVRRGRRRDRAHRRRAHRDRRRDRRAHPRRPPPDGARRALTALASQSTECETAGTGTCNVRHAVGEDLDRAFDALWGRGDRNPDVALELATESEPRTGADQQPAAARGNGERRADRIIESDPRGDPTLDAVQVRRRKVRLERAGEGVARTTVKLPAVVEDVVERVVELRDDELLDDGRAQVERETRRDQSIDDRRRRADPTDAEAAPYRLAG